MPYRLAMPQNVFSFEDPHIITKSFRFVNRFLKFFFEKMKFVYFVTFYRHVIGYIESVYTKNKDFLKSWSKLNQKTVGFVGFRTHTINHAEGVYVIDAKHCMESVARRHGIKPQGKCTFGDAMRLRRYHTR